MTPSSDLPSTSDILDNLDFFAIALVVSATIFPGLTLCIPGLLFVTVLIAIPIVAVVLVVGLAVAVVAAPFVLVRGIRALVERRTVARSLAAANGLEEHSHVRVAA
jgi:predicted membrane channel-forming protein YqfA (hemolysin III family)